MSDVWQMMVASAVLLVLLQAATALWSARAGRWMVADAVWGPGLAAVALLGLVAGRGGIVRRVLLALIVTVWAARLAAHVWHRIRTQDHDDPRYVRMAADRSPVSMMLGVFGVQGLTQWVVSLPLQLSAVRADPHGALWALGVLGALVAVGGVIVEAVADRQLREFRQLDPRPPIMDRGLWGWSRHPNYFGDACVWSGAYLIGCVTWPGPLAVVSPLLMTVLLVWGSGVRLTERAMADRPGYAEYRARTSMFVPWPPRAR